MRNELKGHNRRLSKLYGDPQATHPNPILQIPTRFVGLGEDGVSRGEGALQPRAHPHAGAAGRRQALDGGGQGAAWRQGGHGGRGVDRRDHSAQRLEPRVHHPLVVRLQSCQVVHVVHGIHCNKRPASEQWCRKRRQGHHEWVACSCNNSFNN